MIKNIENFNNLISTFRMMLIKQSELESNRVLNANSVRGQDLSKLTNNNIYTSYKTDDLVMLFEFFENSNDSNVSFTLDDTINQYTSYKVKLIIYGNTSGILANKLKSRLLSSKVQNDLYEFGIYIESISDLETVNEFINNTYWNRCDINININCRYEYSQIDTDEKIDNDYSYQINTNEI